MGETFIDMTNPENVGLILGRLNKTKPTDGEIKAFIAGYRSCQKVNTLMKGR